MSKIKLISDSSCDFTKEEVSLYNVDIIPFSVSFDDVHYLQENIHITYEEFYKKLEDPNVFAKTSLPAVNLYLEAFERAYKDGCEILCFTISSKFSGSYQSAVNAQRIMKEDYPDCKIEIIDTLQVSIAQGNLIKFADKLIKDGKSLEETAQIVRKNTQNVIVYLTVGTLKYLQKGGRIGKVSALTGDILQLAPVLALIDGELISISKVRGSKKAINYLASKVTDFATEKNVNVTDCSVGVFTCTTDVEPLIAKLNSDGIENITKTQIGVTITAHTGITIHGVCVAKFEE